MAKITVSKEHVDMYPSLADQLGKTVDASVISKAASDAKVNAKRAAREGKARTEVAPVAAAAVAPKKKRAPAKKKAASKKAA